VQIEYIKNSNLRKSNMTMSLSPLFQHLKSRTFIFLFEKELQLFEHKNMLGAYFYVSFATQKREIISEGTRMGFEAVGDFAYFVQTK